jgi:enediyne biosynthesis protein E4
LKQEEKNAFYPGNIWKNILLLCKEEPFGDKKAMINFSNIVRRLTNNNTTRHVKVSFTCLNSQGFVRHSVVYLLKLMVIFSAACTSGTEGPLFKQLKSDHTNILFNNLITESDSLNIISFEYIYNGGGVGVGDMNNDGLEDIFFAGNMVSSRLYLNTGGLRFKDVTETAGVATNQWCTGVAMVDINQDGLLDIYVSTIHPNKKTIPLNLLYVNKGNNSDGIPVFEEAAGKVGLADSSYSTQAAFFDFDLDGDLDVYLLTNYIENYNRNTPYGQHHDGTGKSVDKLFRNEGMTNGLPVFTDVSREAGVLSEGWGLGIVVNDINMDGYPDVYVANDFIANDHLYINNRNGTFTNEIDKYLKHQEHDGMGVDIADVNNDALNDIVVLDMMPEDNLRQKAMFSNIGYDRYYLNLQRNYQPQYVRNVLQLNNGNGTFSDIGYLAGVYATDWSWSSLLADFDNDGYRDLFITNGFRKDITDLDFVSYSKDAKMFGTNELKLKRTLEAISKLEGVKKRNWLFKNNGDLTFTNRALEWGLDEQSYSTGAAYADFDNDGDLDIVINNVNDQAFVYENTLNHAVEGRNNFLRIKLNGEDGNRNGIGAKISIFIAGKIMYAEHEWQRGYKSSIDPVEHFGLGSLQIADSIKIVWPSGKMEVKKNVPANHVINVYEKNAAYVEEPKPSLTQKTLLTESHDKYKVFFLHRESDFVDYKQGQALLLHKHSQGGPALAVGDVNNDKLEDFIVGSSANGTTTVFFQQSKGSFKSYFLPSKEEEDMGLLLFDADNDGDLDLYCVSGSSEYGLRMNFYQDRFYRNTGNGNFVSDSTALPEIASSGSCVVASDFDKDGDFDLFVGGRIVPTRYPESPRSYVLQNDGTGNFTDITSTVCPSIATMGMVTSALWTDYNNDGWVDLAIVGEWMPVTFYKNNNGKSFTKAFAEHTGWWNSISGGDFDNDGDIDYVTGNLGLNSLYKATEKEPVSIYAKDYDNNGSIDPLVTRFIQGKEYPTHYRETMTEQIVGLRRKLMKYSIYGKMDFHELFPGEQTKDALIYRSTCFASSYIENTGNGTFKITALPVAAQLSPLFGTTVMDLNNDGNLDLLGIGNCYASETITGFYDAGIGVCLQGDGKGDFKSIPPTKSGFFVDKDAKALAVLNATSNEPIWLASNNQDSLLVFERTSSKAQIAFTAGPYDAFAEVFFDDGSRQKHEFYYGSGYLSQNSRALYVSKGTREVYFTGTDGKRRKVFPQ